MLLVIALFCFGLAIALYLHAFSLRRQRALQTLANFKRYGFRSAEHEATDVPALRQLRTRFEAIAELVGTTAGRQFNYDEQAAQRLLRQAGIYDFAPSRLLGYRLLAGVLLPLGWLLLASHSSPPRMLFGLLFVLFLGFQGPVIYLRRRARLRLDEIDHQMPELIDILVTTVEAGIGFAGSLQLAGRRVKGPLGQELRLTLAEQDMGLSTEEALQHMLERADTPALRSFVRAMLQGETLGVSIGKILRDLADEMRKRRRQKAEERAQKAPTKMLFPLVILIFPALFIVLLGPAVSNLLHGLRGM
jgi:tight adherence protein C